MNTTDNSTLRTLIADAVARKVSAPEPFTVWDITGQIRKENPDTFIPHDKVRAGVRCLFEMGDMGGYARTQVMVGTDLEDAILYHPEGTDPAMHPAVAEAQAEIQRRETEEAEGEVYTCFGCGEDFAGEDFPPTRTDDGPLCPECAGSHTDDTPRGPLGGPAVIIPPAALPAQGSMAGTPSWAVTPPAPLAFRLEHTKDRRGELVTFPDQPSREAAVKTALAHLNATFPDGVTEVLDGTAYAWRPERPNLAPMSDTERFQNADAAITITKI